MRLLTTLSYFLWLQADHTLGHKGLWFQADHRPNHFWSEFGQAGTINFVFLRNMTYLRLDHICPEHGQPGTINLHGPEYDQPGIILWVGWHSMIDLSLYWRETRGVPS